MRCKLILLLLLLFSVLAGAVNAQQIKKILADKHMGMLNMEGNGATSMDSSEAIAPYAQDLSSDANKDRIYKMVY